jgi:hypothetical protein
MIFLVMPRWSQPEQDRLQALGWIPLGSAMMEHPAVVRSCHMILNHHKTIKCHMIIILVV